MIPLLKASKTGYFKSRGHSIYYEIYGDLDSGNVPLLAAHGGPGSSHNYLLPLTTLSKKFPIILYDQLGSGRSQVPRSDRFYAINYFVHELEQLQRQLKLKSVHLLGHSWGGMLAIEYMKKRRPHVKSLILSSAIIDSQLYTKQAMELLKKIDKRYPALALRNERAGTTGSEEYQEMYKKYEKRDIFRVGYRNPALQ